MSCKALELLRHWHKREGIPFSMSTQEREGVVALGPLFAQIHHSWISPFFARYPLTRLLIPHLPSSLRCVMRSKFPPFALPLAPPLASFLRERMERDLFQYLCADLPLPAKNVSPMHCLEKKTKTQLLSLCDLLSMYDLAESLRRIVDTSVLRSVRDVLTKEQTTLLRSLLMSKNTWTPSQTPILLDDPKRLSSILRRQGLLRLALALSGEDPYIQWKVVHRLNHSTGSALQRFILSSPVSGGTVAAQNQIYYLLGQMETKGSTP